MAEISAYKCDKCTAVFDHGFEFHGEVRRTGAVAESISPIPADRVRHLCTECAHEIFGDKSATLAPPSRSLVSVVRWVMRAPSPTTSSERWRA